MLGNDADLYAILGVPRTAPAAELARVYRRLVLALHPDTRPVDTPDRHAAADAELAKVIAAYEVLGDPARRAAYDRQLPRERQGQEQHGPTSRPGIRIPVRVVKRSRPRRSTNDPTRTWPGATWPAGSIGYTLTDLHAMLDWLRRQ